MDFESLRFTLLLFIVLMLSIALHEYGHAKVADLLGDPLPRSQGRVTLNPLAHWDPFGTVLIAVCLISSGGAFCIGWGKPVMISLPNRKTRVRDDILITLAGPGMNLLIAIGAAVVGGLILRFFPGEGDAADGFAGRTVHFVVMTLSLNIGLIAFNMIPLPPLDGSHILRHVTRMKDETYHWLTRNSIWIFLALIFLPPGGPSLIYWLTMPVRVALTEPLTKLVQLVAGNNAA